MAKKFGTVVAPAPRVRLLESELYCLYHKKHGCLCPWPVYNTTDLERRITTEEKERQPDLMT